MRIKGIRTLYYQQIITITSVLTCALLLMGCGGRNIGSLSGDQDEQAALPSLEAKLELELHKAFSELGIDPEKVASSAPSGEDNQVFDLDATLDDPDGPGGAPVARADLAWTEVLCGDYDGNSEIGYPDICPLAQFYLDMIIYDPPEAHGGYKYWPPGDPEGDASERLNWWLARIDGDRNTEISNFDITRIAMHWRESLAGYDVYAKAPGYDEFSLVEKLSRPHLPVKPVRYHLDYTFAAEGVYEFCVAPYDHMDVIGQASPLLRINTTTGTTQHQPVAIQVPHRTGYAGPRTYLLNANSSYCLDGGVAAYIWDFDGDGITDWNSNDTPPALSSTGLVDSITNDFRTPGMVLIHFVDSAEGEFNQSVVVVDSNGWESEPSTTTIQVKAH